jgi:hypothetical protein
MAPKTNRFPHTLCCNIHPWMNARVGVFDHPYFAVTDERGAFEIRLAPKGAWRLKVWHEKVGWRGGAEGKDGQKIEVRDQRVTDLGDLDLKP